MQIWRESVDQSGYRNVSSLYHVVIDVTDLMCGFELGWSEKEARSLAEFAWSRYMTCLMWDPKQGDYLFKSGQRKINEMIR